MRCLAFSTRLVALRNLAPIKHPVSDAFDVTAVEMSTAARRAGAQGRQVEKFGHLCRRVDVDHDKAARCPTRDCDIGLRPRVHHCSIVARLRVAAWTPPRTNGTLSRHGNTDQPRPA